MKNDDKVCILGLGYIGLSLATTLAESGVKVLGVDVIPEVIDKLRAGTCPFYEPGLTDLVRKHIGQNMNVSLSVRNRSSNFYVICVGTPIDQETGKPRLEYIESATRSILPHIKKGDTVILRSTVPPGTSRNLVAKMIESNTGLVCGKGFYFGFVPERTVEGNALYEQKYVPQIVGAFNAESSERIVKLFSTFNQRLIHVPDIEHAEFCKVIDNTYRDVSFAYANQMAMICEELRLDFNAVRTACNNNYPRNNIPSASPGVGGACLTKDPYILIDLCNKLKISAELIRSARSINEMIVCSLAKKIVCRLKELGKKVDSSKIFIMGFAFKGNPETSDMRFSTTIDLVNQLKHYCSNLYGYDKTVSDAEIESSGVTSCSITDGFEKADAVVIMNAHKSHRKLDIEKLSGLSNAPLVFVDCWNLYEKDEVQKSGNIVYSSVGLY